MRATRAVSEDDQARCLSAVSFGCRPEQNQIHPVGPAELSEILNFKNQVCEIQFASLWTSSPGF